MRMQKGQASLEYLLIAGGVLVVVALVIALLVGINQPAGEQAVKDTIDLLCSRKGFNINDNGTIGANECTNQPVEVNSKTYHCKINTPENTKCVWDGITPP